MGLDMYLRRKKYIGANYEHRNVTGNVKIKIGGKEIPVDFKRLTYIEEEGCYWRKANQIHKWFVDNVQDGNDNCGYYYVSTKSMKELLDLCKEVKENPSKAPELLPTQDGFFFGGTEYDEWYFKDIDYTIDELTRLLDEEKQMNEDGFYSDFEYHSSW